jgi:putative heme-binding domain-containing protein
MRLLALTLAAVCVATAARAQSSTQSPAGNEANGAAIVAGKGKCQTCHRIAGTGSPLGPDLTDIGATRTVGQIQTSLLDPQVLILPEHRSYRVVTRDGTTMTGTLLNHDTFQVLLRDQKNQLRTFNKSELREHGFVAGSPMPSYRSTLSEQELNDVIAYLLTLKGVAAQ